MSGLDGLEYIAYAVEASPGWEPLLHVPRHRTFGPGDATAYAVAGSDEPEVHGTARLLAEQGDTLVILVNGEHAPMTLALTVLSPTAAELTATSSGEWARCVVALIGLPAGAHDH
jgi:hypothetical protein